MRNSPRVEDSLFPLVFRLGEKAPPAELVCTTIAVPRVGDDVEVTLAEYNLHRGRVADVTWRVKLQGPSTPNYGRGDNIAVDVKVDWD